MLRTIQFACTLPKAEADALNRERARIYNDTLTRHYRLYRKQGVWLSLNNGKRVEDMTGGPTPLHAHSRDAAQEAFYKACKTARALQSGRDGREVSSLAENLSYHHLDKQRYPPENW